MVHWTLPLLPLLCVGATNLKRIIYRINENKTWIDAQAYCRQHHTDLLTIRTQDENDLIIHDGWIGLYSQLLGIIIWGWSNGYVDNNFYIWSSGEPILDLNCGFKMEGDVGWHSRSCEDPFPFYCMEEFILVEQEKPWEEALEHCRNLQLDPTVYGNHSYDLASPLTLENVYAQDIFQSDFYVVWIGLRYLGDQWSWLNGQYYDDYLHCPSVNRCGTLENIKTAITMRRKKCQIQSFFLCSWKSNF